jgi:hypothetical protein
MTAAMTAAWAPRCGARVAAEAGEGPAGGR